MEFTATFYTHFGASLFCRRTAESFSGVRPAPVPRCLSASCGVCAVFSAENAPQVTELVRTLAEDCEIEALYGLTEEKDYVQLLRFA